MARRFAALSEPLRLKLIRALQAGEKSVHALMEETGGSQTNVSRHLHTLAEAGILARRKVGAEARYSIADPIVLHLCELTCGSLEKHLAAQARIFA